ncbi:MAG: hypothetical protein V4685_15175 [Bacteroidota bacterium]
MKKMIIAVVVIIAIFVSASYIFIPNIISVKRSVIININSPALQRKISDIRNWGEWWPGEKNSAKLILNGNAYSIQEKTTNLIFISISNPSATIKSSLSFSTVARDSSNIQLYTQIPTSYNPVKRTAIFFASRQLQQDFDLLLKSLKSHYSTIANVYGIDIKRELVKDSSLIFTSASFKNYPTNEEIYSLINKLRGYINDQSAVPTDSPMLNVRREGSSVYVTKVAIPVNKMLDSKGDITYKWMLPKGNILTADIKGGRQKVDSAFVCIENYIEDNYMNSPAIPYYSLITNRIAEKDSSKWITRIYYPIIF